MPWHVGDVVFVIVASLSISCKGLTRQKDITVNNHNSLEEDE